MTQDTLTEITRLSVAERIQLVEDIWDSIAADSSDLPVTAPQKAELDRRLSAFQETAQPGSSWEDVKQRVLGK